MWLCSSRCPAPRSSRWVTINDPNHSRRGASAKAICTHGQHAPERLQPPSAGMFCTARQEPLPPSSGACSPWLPAILPGHLRSSAYLCTHIESPVYARMAHKDAFSPAPIETCGVSTQYLAAIGNVYPALFALERRMIGRLLCLIGTHDLAMGCYTPLKLVSASSGHQTKVGEEITWRCQRPGCAHAFTAQWFNSATARRKWERSS